VTNVVAVAGGTLPATTVPTPAAAPFASTLDAAARDRGAATEAAIRQQLADYLRAHEQSVSIQHDKQTGMTIVKVFNDSTGELVRQIPAEELVRIAQYFNEQHPLLNTKA
jgi:flagellar protein FlaG